MRGLFLLLAAYAIFAMCNGPTFAAPCDEVYARPGNIVAASGTRLNFARGDPTIRRGECRHPRG